MDITLIIQSLLGLISLLAILMIFLFYTPQAKKRAEAKKEQTQERGPQRVDTSLEALRKIIRNGDSTTQELSQALELVLKYHSVIHPKLGMRPHPDFDSYAEILFHLGRHKHINKEILMKFNKELEKQNPSYKKEIDEALMRGLNSRGF